MRKPSWGGDGGGGGKLPVVYGGGGGGMTVKGMEQGKVMVVGVEEMGRRKDLWKQGILSGGNSGGSYRRRILVPLGFRRHLTA